MTRRPRHRRPGRRRQRGFTLIELMVALLISTLLVILILSIFGRMSFAYREQQSVVTVQQVLSAVRGAIEHDARHAGYQLSQGFTIAADGAGAGGVKHSPLRVINRSDGPDELRFYYADSSVQAVVVSTGPATTLTVDDATGFAAGDLVVLVTTDTETLINPVEANDARLTLYRACVAQIATIAPAQVVLSIAPPWGAPDNPHCHDTVALRTMMYRFVARYWRIDPTRPADNVLQLDGPGHLVGAPVFRDQAMGVTDLQVSTYFYDRDSIDTGDPDADPDRDWYASAAQTTLTAPILRTNDFIAPLVLSLSVVARTPTDVEGIATARTPQLTDPTNVNHNMLGDRDSIELATTSDPALTGRRVFRHVTTQIDLRNMGVGR